MHLVPQLAVSSAISIPGTLQTDTKYQCVIVALLRFGSDVSNLLLCNAAVL